MVRPIAFGTVTRDALPDQIASRLIALITERQLKAGDRLPPERELAATMGVSRSSLREALRALAMLGVAEMRQGDGTYLTNLQPDSLMRSVGLVLALSDSGLEELFEARKLVEPGLAELAAERISRRGRRRAARAAPRRTHDALDDPEAFMWADIELHAKIARAAVQRRARAAAGVDRGHGHRQPPPHRPAGAGARAERARPSWRSRPRSRPTTAKRPSRRCCAIWRTSNGR